jgi:hypothetical protein
VRPPATPAKIPVISCNCLVFKRICNGAGTKALSGMVVANHTCEIYKHCFDSKLDNSGERRIKSAIIRFPQNFNRSPSKMKIYLLFFDSFCLFKVKGSS